LRRNFCDPVLFETIFAFGKVALRYAAELKIPAGDGEFLISGVTARVCLRSRRDWLGRLAHGANSCWRPRHLDPEGEIARPP
jgi:hypothetical protein